MDMFDGGVKKIKKVPSPILHLLKEDAKETDELPKPRWGADNAPPVVGAVYKGSRDENVGVIPWFESLPPLTILEAISTSRAHPITSPATTTIGSKTCK